jgi:8-oxo-dGTP pyrophosphatase MutT (NUDIX family)
VWIATSNGGCQLPGGHVERGEDIYNALIRELKEETGMEIVREEVEGPFFELRHYTVTSDKRYRRSNILYFYVKTDKVPDSAKTNFTKQEKEYNFTLSKIPFANAEQYIKSFMGENQTQINRIIAQEVLDAFGELKIFLEEQNNG